jgi:hypothetical protein
VIYGRGLPWSYFPRSLFLPSDLIEETEQGVPWHSLEKVRRWNALVVSDGNRQHVVAKKDVPKAVSRNGSKTGSKRGFGRILSSLSEGIS